jgi:phosphohistidine swiveling domain-containing protein
MDQIISWTIKLAGQLDSQDSLILQHVIDARASGTVLLQDNVLVEAITGDAPELLEGRSSNSESWLIHHDGTISASDISKNKILDSNALLRFRSLIEKIDQRAYLEWSFSKDGTIYFYEFSELSDRVKDSVDDPPTFGDSRVFLGTAASAGRGTGTLRLVRSLADVRLIEAGEIAVIQNAGREFNLFLSRVSGVVSENGGVTSHGSLLAREHGVPCVVQVKNALQVLPGGRRAIVDGSKGLVIVAESEA